MKRPWIVLIPLMVATAAWSAAPPESINYQGVLRTSTDNPLDGSYNMVFRFYDGDGGAPPCPASGGTLLLTDSHLGAGAVTVTGGLFNAALGGGSVSPGAAATVAEVFRDYATVYLEVEVGGETLCPRVRVLSAGYALNASNLDGRAPSGFLDTSPTPQTKVGDLALLGNVGIGTTSPARSLHLSYGSGILMQGDDSVLLTLRFQDDDTGNIYEIVGDTSSEGLSFSMNGTRSVFMAATGNVGIGTSAPSSALEVVGHAIVSGGLTANVVQTGTLEATTGGIRFPDGSVQTSAAIVRNIISTLDAQYEVGLYCSIAIGNDGNPVISYYARTPDYDLKVARCTDPSCLAATNNTVDSAGYVGQHTSITIGNDGNPVISYYDATNQDLKVAHCTGPGCAGAAINTVDSAGEVGLETSIAIGYDGNPVISYYDATNEDLKVARCTDPGCAGATLATLDSAGNVGRYTSITIGSDNIPVISYYDATNGDLKVAKCTGPGCYNAELNTVDSTGFVGQFTSIAIGSDGNPVISHHSSTPDYDLKLSHCTTYNCSVATTNTLDDTGDVGSVGTFTSIAVGSDGNPIISYYDDFNDDLKVAHCNDPDCGSATLSTLDSPGGVGRHTSIAVGSDGHAVVSYYDQTNEDLKVITQVVGPVGPPGVPLGGQDHGSGVPGAVAGGGAANAHSIHGASSCTVMGLGPVGGGTGDLLRGHGLLRDDAGNVYARSFRSSAADLASVVEVVGPVEPGDVLVIDAERPGWMSLARQPSDSAVLGVVAGEPGVVLSADPPADGHGEGAEFESGDPSALEVGTDTPAAVVRAPVAVSGIVTCKVDAGYGPIRPGDLLTTSHTPGHAMVSHDPRPGTILGKALEPLEFGTGKIKVLVMLR